MNKMNVIILAGGRGARLRSIVSDRPKVMAEVNGSPFLDKLIKKLVDNGFQKIILSIGYMAEKVEEYYRNSEWAEYIEYAVEKEPMGTGGALMVARKYIDSDQVLVMNGDSYCEVGLDEMIENYLRNEKSRVTMALTDGVEREDGGNILMDRDGLITSFQEKEDKEGHKYINAGVYVMDRQVLNMIPIGAGYSLEYGLFPRLANRNLYGFKVESKLLDIGTPERYRESDKFFNNKLETKDNNMSEFYRDKKVLVTGGTGMIGKHLVELLIKAGAKVKVASMDDPSRAHLESEFVRLDLRDFNNCLEACEGMDYVFHLAGIKGSPKATHTKPASFFVPTITFNTNMAEAARRQNVKWYLYTSTVGVYAPAKKFKEDDVWKSFPSENDKFAGWAKRMGELQLEAYGIEYGEKNYSVVRPANVYGPHDNFNPNNSMVIPSLIKRAMDGEDPFVVWGDGTPVRDFIHARDVARQMMFVVENKISEPVNAGSGEGISIKELVEIIVSNLDKELEVKYDTTKPTGDEVRLMDVSRIQGYGFKNEVSFEEGIKEVMKWYKENKERLDIGYNVFDKDKQHDD